VNPEGTLNDPNGLCFWRDAWHLFYQAYPPEDPRQHWGHAVSKDLVHWRDLPLAIYPNPEKCCFSGATLVEEDRVIAIYHGTEVGNMVAVSSDPLLLNWEKLTGQPVIPISSPDGSPLPYRVHDPCIWRKDGLYYALSNGRDWWRELDYLFCSEDLVSWDYLHPFVENDRFTLQGDDGACPYFWPIGDRHILLFFSHMSGGQYLLGDYDKTRDKLVADSHGKFNFGASTPSGVHAPSATPDGEGGVIVIFNMNAGKPAEGWNQIMTLPRRLSLDGKSDLLIELAGDMESLRDQHVHLGERTLPANQEVVLEGVSGKAMELLLRLDPGEAPMLELCLLRSPGGEEVTRFAFYKDRGYRRLSQPGTPTAWPGERDSVITLDTSRSSVSPDALSRPPENAPLPFESGQLLELRVFVDHSVVEVFANGRQCVAARVYPVREDSLGVTLRAQGREARMVSADAWAMNSIYV
jgi:beta-fructofuranosidase